MSSLSRSLRRKKQREQKKAAKKKLSKIGRAIQAMPDHCFRCKKPVDKANIGSQLDWFVEIDNKNNMRLTCPDCQGEK